ERPQDGGAATYGPKLRREDEILTWEEAAPALVRRIRALSPSPGASTSFRGRGLKVFRAREGPPASGAQPGGGSGPQPGTLILGPEGGLGAVAGSGWVELREVQPEGRNRMTGEEFVRGYRPGPQERLG